MMSTYLLRIAGGKQDVPNALKCFRVGFFGKTENNRNDCWTGTVLFGANACLQFYKIDVSALELPIRFQMRTSILICKSPLRFGSGLLLNSWW